MLLKFAASRAQFLGVSESKFGSSALCVTAALEGLEVA